MKKLTVTFLGIFFVLNCLAQRHSTQFKILDPLYVVDSLGNNVGICQTYQDKEKIGKIHYVIDLTICPKKSSNPLATNVLFVLKGRRREIKNPYFPNKTYKLEDNITYFSIRNDGKNIFFQYVLNDNEQLIQIKL